MNVNKMNKIFRYEWWLFIIKMKDLINLKLLINWSVIENDAWLLLNIKGLEPRIKKQIHNYVILSSTQNWDYNIYSAHGVWVLKWEIRNKIKLKKLNILVSLQCYIIEMLLFHYYSISIKPNKNLLLSQRTN